MASLRPTTLGSFWVTNKLKTRYLNLLNCKFDATKERRMNMSVTVGVFAHNHEKYVTECLESMAKSGLHVERLVITDDASLDDTVKLIEAFLLKESSNNWIVERAYSSRNLGFARQLNMFLNRVETEWFIILSADDYFPIGALEALVEKAIEFPTADVVFGRLQRVDLNSKNLTETRRNMRLTEFAGHRYSTPTRPFRDLLRLGNFIPGGGTLIRTRPVSGQLPEYDPDLTNAEDYDWNLALGATAKCVFLNRRVLNYRILSTSKSRRTGIDQTRSLLKIVKKHLVSCSDTELGLAQEAAVRFWLRPILRREWGKVCYWSELISLPTMTTTSSIRRILSVAISEFRISSGRVADTST